MRAPALRRRDRRVVMLTSALSQSGEWSFRQLARMQAKQEERLGNGSEDALRRRGRGTFWWASLGWRAESGRCGLEEEDHLCITVDECVCCQILKNWRTPVQKCGVLYRSLLLV